MTRVNYREPEDLLALVVSDTVVSDSGRRTVLVDWDGRETIARLMLRNEHCIIGSA